MIDITTLSDRAREALIGLFFARLGTKDERLQLKDEYWKAESARYNRSVMGCKQFRDRMDKYFDNRKGYQDEKLDETEQAVLDKYGQIPLEELEAAAKALVDTFRSETAPDSFISLRLSSKLALNGKREISIQGFEDTVEALTVGKQVFISLTGPNPGFLGFGHVSGKAYPASQGRRIKYACKVTADLLLKTPLPRYAFQAYPEAYNAPLLIYDVPFNVIAPLEYGRAVKIVKALLDRQPELKERVETLFSADFMDRVQGHEDFLEEKTAEYGPDIKEHKAIPLVYDTSLKTHWPYNRILFGAPGTGKSWKLEEDRKSFAREDYIRVTFHPDYSYAHFVGTYKPVSSWDDRQKKSIISYEYVPGPFLRAYVEALKSGRTARPKPFLLIIEEINRASMAAVFGDVFQLLDRDSNGVSQYPVEASEDMRKYLAKALGGAPEDYSRLWLPNNLFLWATMNSADQGVFPMDTAFKRRWNFEYLGIDDNEEGIKGLVLTLGEGKYRQTVEWNSLRKAINSFLAEAGIAEDKQLGPYFISGPALEDEGEFVKLFASKVLMYLYEDAARQKRALLFGRQNIRYSEVRKGFLERGVDVFSPEIVQASGRILLSE